MQLREKKSHISGELGMSSMTDIIFILLMFFMMTSTLTAPSALNLELPGKSKAANRLVKEKLTDVAIKNSGSYLLNGKSARLDQIRSLLEAKANNSTDQVNITVSPDKGAPVENVVAILDVTTNLGINAILNVEDFE